MQYCTKSTTFNYGVHKKIHEQKQFEIITLFQDSSRAEVFRTQLGHVDTAEVRLLETLPNAYINQNHQQTNTTSTKTSREVHHRKMQQTVKA